MKATRSRLIRLFCLAVCGLFLVNLPPLKALTTLPSLLLVASSTSNTSLTYSLYLDNHEYPINALDVHLDFTSTSSITCGKLTTNTKDLPLVLENDLNQSTGRLSLSLARPMYKLETLTSIASFVCSYEKIRPYFTLTTSSVYLYDGLGTEVPLTALDTVFK